MSESFRKTADQVVEKFKNHLGESQSKISINDYDVLSNLIAAAIADEMVETSQEIESILNRIRNAVEKPDLAL